MVSSAVVGLEETLERVFNTLAAYGYHVWMSHAGTLPVDSNKSNFQNCLDAVERCDAFLGIITGRYGSGRVDSEPSITHLEMRRAVELGKLRYFAVHHHVTTAREVLKSLRYDRDHRVRELPDFRRNKIIDDLRVLDLYDEVILSGQPLAERRGNWAQEYTTTRDLLRYVEAQFEDSARIRALLEHTEGGPT